MGESGSGKTTLLQTLSKQLPSSLTALGERGFTLSVSVLERYGGSHSGVYNSDIGYWNLEIGQLLKTKFANNVLEFKTQSTNRIMH